MSKDPLSPVDAGTTHYEGCWDAGPKHYECALRKIREAACYGEPVAYIDEQDSLTYAKGLPKEDINVAVKFGGWQALYRRADTPNPAVEVTTTHNPFGTPERNWPDTQYLCTCCECKQTFMGHKRQIVCRKCVEEKAEPSERVDMPTPRADAVVRPYIGTDHISPVEMNSLLDLSRQLERELAAANAENARLREDAERYRWLRDVADNDFMERNCHLYSAQIDGVIDAARRTEK